MTNSGDELSRLVSKDSQQYPDSGNSRGVCWRIRTAACIPKRFVVAFGLFSGLLLVYILRVTLSGTQRDDVGGAYWYLQSHLTCDGGLCSGNCTNDEGVWLGQSAKGVCSGSIFHRLRECTKSHGCRNRHRYVLVATSSRGCVCRLCCKCQEAGCAARLVAKLCLAWACWCLPS